MVCYKEMTRMKRTLLLVFGFFSINIAQQLRVENDAVAGYESIKANDLRAHLMFLASAELEGRETTFRGQKVAAQYLATQFRKMGLKPLGIGDSYFQQYDLEVTRASRESKISVTPSKGKPVTFNILTDFLPTSVRESTLTAPVVLIGYVDNKLDSVALARLAGKIVIGFAGGRTTSRDTSLPRSRRSFATRQFPGSLAVLVIVDEDFHGTIENDLTPLFSNELEKGTMRLPGSPGGRGFGGNTYMVSSRLANEIATTSKLNIQKLRGQALVDSTFKPIVFDRANVTIDSKVIREIKSAENVAGFLEGNDPILKDEVVIFTAHYDHLGVNDGAIYYGADDDGSGTSVLLEIAEAFATNPTKPRRSMLFMAVSGEEKGLLGSRYYVENPLFPLEKTTANINMDMVGRIDKKYLEQNFDRYVYVIGSDKISVELDSLLNTANKESENLTLDYTYNDENDPNQFYRRSDHYNFARNGVPVVFFFTGIHEDYHRPTDTVDKIMFEKTERIGRLAYYLGWKIANAKAGLLKKELGVSPN